MARSRVALVVEGVAAIVVGDGKSRIELDRLVVVGDGAIEVALLIKRIAALVVGAGMLRIELRIASLRSAMAWSRSPSRAVGDAAIVVDAGVPGVEADRLVVIGDRSIALALVVMGVAAIVVGLGVGRIEADGGIEIGDGAVVVPFLVGNEAAIVVGKRELG